MPKKFFDIIPPKEIESYLKEPNIKELKYQKKIKSSRQYLKPEGKASYQDIVVEKKNLERKNHKRGTKPKKFFSKSLIFCLIFVAIIIIGVVGYSILSKTEIEIWPKTEILDLKEIITISSEAVQPDFSAKIIPGTVFKDQKTTSQEFSSTGKILKEEKAKGIIRVYNAYSTTAQPLLASTRFVSADGKLFKSIKRELIPGATYEKGKLTPSYIDIEVQAAEAGENYNIGPSTFSIPGFVGTPKYTAFYGKSFAPMKGGLRDEVPQVTLADIEKAKNELISKLKKESKDFLKTTIPKDFILLDETISQEIIKEKTSVEAGSEAKSFDFQAEIKSEGMAFKKADIDNFAKNLISLNIAKDKKFQEESLQINFSFKNKEAGRITINSEIKVKIYPDLDLNELKKALLGKSLQEVRIFLGDQPQITKIEVNSSPFWRKKIPDNIEKVKIILKLVP